ncbi:MAG: rRNA maturation RNase YbeY [Verrucomicrobiota bacterium]
MSDFYLRNRQQTRPINVALLKRIAAALLAETGGDVRQLGIVLVADAEMARLNEAYLQHRGPTDVLAFGYATEKDRALHGELFICVDEALRQAPRFHTSWQREVVRYLAHGLLHLQGHDDKTAPKRRRMKARENALLRSLGRQFTLDELAGSSK